jgi:hypothetical protein
MNNIILQKENLFIISIKNIAMESIRGEIYNN